MIAEFALVAKEVKAQARAKEQEYRESLNRPGVQPEYIKIANAHQKQQIEVRDSRTGHLVPGRDGLGVWPDGKIVGMPPPSPFASPGNAG